MFDLNVAGTKIKAISVAGVETCIELCDYGFAFDIGRCHESAIKLDTILLTHGHVDHCGGIAYHAARRAGLGLSIPTYIVPKVIEQELHGYFAALSKLDRSAARYKLIALEPGQLHQIGRGITVKPFETIHRVPCHGYQIYHTRKKLKPEYVGLTNNEIIKVKSQGTEISETIEVFKAAFIGDTIIDVFDKTPELYQAELLIMEVSFLDDEDAGVNIDVEKARSRGHIHLNEVADRAHLFNNRAILFTHFSTRYSRERILKTIKAKLPSLHDRITCLV